MKRDSDLLFCTSCLSPTLIWFCFLISTQTVYSQASQEWKLRKFENDVSIYTRNAENSSFKELMSETNIKSSLSSIVAVLNDWESYPQWVYKCGTSSTLLKKSDTEVIHYQTVEAPWPVDSRDFIVDVKLAQDDKTKQVIIRSTSMPDYIPKIPGLVRITEFKAFWILTPMKDGTVKVVYQLLVDPGGLVPAWLVNLAVIEGPFVTAVNLRERAVSARYKNIRLSYVKELD
jgi:hypothetical protein